MLGLGLTVGLALARSLAIPRQITYRPYYDTTHNSPLQLKSLSHIYLRMCWALLRVSSRPWKSGFVEGR